MTLRLRILLLILGGSLMRMDAAELPTPESLFTQGVEAARAADFARAAESFRGALAQQPAAGTLVNLGIAEWRRGRAGAAILAWEQALWMDPYNKAARGNLEFARYVVQLNGPELRWYETASTWLPPGAWAWLAWASLWGAVAAMLLPRALRWRRAGWHQALGALGLGIFLLSIPANIGIITRARIGILVDPNISLRLTPTEEAESSTPLAAGDPARKIRTRGNYLLVETARGSGWVKREQFGAICPRRDEAWWLKDTRSARLLPADETE